MPAAVANFATGASNCPWAKLTPALMPMPACRSRKSSSMALRVEPFGPSIISAGANAASASLPGSAMAVPSFQAKTSA